MTDAFIAQFGESLYSSSTDTTTTPSEAFHGKDYVLLYFSAKWCGPCRNFTPLLIDFYKKMKEENEHLEIVFCSLDSDEDQYKEYSKKMPWLSMPFGATETKVMSRKYNAQGIPHLVVVNAKTGEVITEDGTTNVRSDKNGEKFPWKPKSFGEVWPEHILANKDSEADTIASSDFKDKYLMLYFSAHWCPPCRAFTPKLSNAYTKLKAEKSDFELAFVSSDRDESAFKEYFESMTFCALPYENRDAKATLSKMYKVQGIPTLVMLGPADEDGNRPLINDNIRSFIETEAFGDFPFEKKNYGNVESGAGDLNDEKALIIFHENGDDDEHEEIKNIAKTVATELKGDESKETINILWALTNKGIVARIRSLTGLPEMSEEPAMVLLDIPDEGGYYKTENVEITAESVKSFIENPGDRMQLT